MFPVLLAEEDCSIKRGQPSITRDLPMSSLFLAEVFLTIYHYCYGVVGNMSPESKISIGQTCASPGSPPEVSLTSSMV